MDMNAYLSMFIDESNDHRQSLNENLLKLESEPDRHQYRTSHFPLRLTRSKECRQRWDLKILHH